MLSDLVAETADQTPPPTDLFEVLEDSRRRTVLGMVQSETGQIDLTYLSQRIALYEDEAELTASSLQDIAITLAHNHLPKLDAVDVVDYLHDENRVEAGDRLEHFQGHL